MYIKKLYTKQVRLIWLALGIFFTVSGSNPYWKLHQAHSWHSVHTTILSSYVCRWWTGKGYAYTPLITYGYDSGGTAFVGRTVGFGATALDRDEADELIQRFAKGKQTLAYVDPNDNRSAVLDRDRLMGQVKFPLVVGIFLILLGLSLFFFDRDA
jgi:hypothetical protein